MTPALVRYRLQGARLTRDGTAVCRNRVLAKVSRPEVAQAFLSPAPERIVAQLLSAGKINGEQARLSRHVPMCDALCVEADSGGHTDQGVAATLIPAFVRLRDQYMAGFRYPHRIAVGAAGGSGRRKQLPPPSSSVPTSCSPGRSINARRRPATASR